MSLPNLITILRLLLAPILVISLLNGHFLLAIIIVSIAGLSDILDGLLARRLNQCTNLGSCLDPIADKILISSSFVLLAWLRFIPNWLAVVVISRDVLILLGSLLLFLFNIHFEVRPSLLGKMTTAFQMITIFVTLLAQLSHIDFPLFPLLWSTMGLTLASGTQYLYRGYRLCKVA